MKNILKLFSVIILFSVSSVNAISAEKVEFLKTRNRNYVYITEKYKIKCERKFEVNPRNIVVGFSSKNCF